MNALCIVKVIPQIGRELLKTHRINHTSPVTYTLGDENTEQIKAKYEQKLSGSVSIFESNNKTSENMSIFQQFE